VEQENGYEVLISTSAYHSLAKRAGKNKVPLSIVEQVYARGYVTADLNSKNSPQQQAFQRVDSFLHGGQAQNLDEDLTEKINVPDGSKHMHIVKQAIARHKKRDNPLKEDVLNEEGVPPLGTKTAKIAGKTIRGAYRLYKKTREIQRKSRENTSDISSTSTPKRRKYKYEKEAETEKRNAHADQKSRERESSERERVKLQYGHGSGPLSRDELKRIKKAEGKSSSSSHKSDKKVDGTKTWYAPGGKGSGEQWVDKKSKFKHKLATWAHNKLRRIRKKYENSDE